MSNSNTMISYNMGPQVTVNVCPECSRWRTVRRKVIRLPFLRLKREYGWRFTLILRPRTAAKST